MANPMSGMKSMIIVMIVALFIAAMWNTIPIIKISVDFILNPTFGKILNWNLLWGMIMIVFVLNILQTLIHKYTTDQEALKKLKEEQKETQKRMKELKDQPEKMMELQKQQMANLPKSMSMSMKSAVYTAVPLILFFRWFDDFFEILGDPKILFGIGWIGSYLILSIVFSMVLRKVMKVH